MKKGLLISVEGLDGSGKTTQVRGIIEYFESKGIEPLMVREPGGTNIGEMIRRILLDNKNSEMDKVTEMLLYAASRAQNVNENIIPALEEGRVVIADRFIDSSVAFQGYGRELDVSEVYDINLSVIKHRLPDVTFFLDKRPEASLRRRIEASGADRLESEKLEFHDRVYRGYLELCEKYPDRIVRLDAEDSIESIKSRIAAVLDGIIERT